MAFADHELVAPAGVTYDRDVAEEHVERLAAAGIQARIRSFVEHARTGRALEPKGLATEAQAYEVLVHPFDYELAERSFAAPRRPVPAEMRDDDPEIAAWLEERAAREARRKEKDRRGSKRLLVYLLVVFLAMVAWLVWGALIPQLTGR